jgi:hypothetical protein
VNRPSLDELVEYAARQGVSFTEAQAYFDDLLIEHTEHVIMGGGDEPAAPSPMFELGEVLRSDEDK